MKRGIPFVPFTLLISAVAWAGPPSVLSFTGTLSDPTGEPAADDSYDVSFRIFGTDTGGVALWSEDDTVDTESGVFSTELGQLATIPAALFEDNDALYLELEVEGDVLTPRFAIASAPWALDAKHASEADALSCSGCVGSAEIAAGAITSSSLANGSVGAIDLTDGATLAELADDDGASSGLDCDLFDGLNSSAFATASHIHSGADVTSGTVGTDFYSAVSDLTDEGYLDNNAGTDILTRSQADGRFVEQDELDSVTPGMISSGTVTSVELLDGGVGFVDWSDNGCADGDVPKLSGSVWICAADSDSDSGGTVTIVGTGSGLTGGPITSSGTISIATGGVTASHLADGATLAEISDDDGAGSGLDCDLFDGLSSAAFATASHSHSGADITSGTLGTGFYSAYGDLTAEGILDNNAAGDLLTRSQSDGRYVQAGELDAVTLGMIAPDSVTDVEITDGSVTFADWAGNSCADGDIPKANSGAWECAPDDDANSGGTVTSVSTGSGLTGGPITGSGTISIATGGVTASHLADGSTISEIADDDGAGSGLDCDLLDGQSSAAFAGAAHSHAGADITSGTVGTGFYSAYSDLTAEGILDNNATTDLLTQTQSDGRFVNEAQTNSISAAMIIDGATLSEIADDDGAGSGLDCDLLDGLSAAAFAGAAHAHSGGDITSGTVGTGFYSAYTDLTAEGILDNNATTDLLTQSQSDGRFVNEAQADSVDSSMITVDTITAADIGPGAVTTSELLDGTVAFADIAQNGCTTGQLPKWNGTAWACAADIDTDTQAALLQVPRVSTKTTADSTGAVGAYTSATHGADALPVMAYWDGTNNDLKVLKCGNTACSSGNTLTTVDSTGDVGKFASIAVGGDGLPVVSYWDETNNDLKVAKCGNAACSSGNTLTSVDTTGSVGQFTSIAISTDGFPVVSYWDQTTDDLNVAKCGNTSCSASNTLTSVDTTGTIGQHTSITLGADGFPVISYWNSGTSDLKVARCGNALCSAGNTLTSVDTASAVGQYTSITIAEDGLPVISYWDTTGNDLKIARCGNNACSAGNTLTAVDTTGAVGAYTSISIGPTGYPVVAYEDSTNGDLKVMRCGSLTCATNNRLTVVDSSGATGQYTSITMGPDGFPLIAYRDVTNSDLRVAKCTNNWCVDHWARR